MCDHSNELSLAILSHGTICFAVFGKMKFGVFLEFLLWPVLGVKGLNAFQGSILAVVRSSETSIKSCGQVSKITNSSGGRLSFKGQNFFSSISHHSMYPCFECLPAIQ